MCTLGSSALPEPSWVPQGSDSRAGVQDPHLETNPAPREMQGRGCAAAGCSHGEPPREFLPWCLSSTGKWEMVRSLCTAFTHSILI